MMQFLLEMVTPTWRLIFGFFVVFCIFPLSIILTLAVSRLNIRSGPTQELFTSTKSTISKIFTHSMKCSTFSRCKIVLDNGAKLPWIMRASIYFIHKNLVDKFRYLSELFRHPEYLSVGLLFIFWPNHRAIGSVPADCATYAARSESAQSIAFSTHLPIKFAEDDPPWCKHLAWAMPISGIFMSLQNLISRFVVSDFYGFLMTTHDPPWLCLSTVSPYDFIANTLRTAASNLIDRAASIAPPWKLKTTTESSIAALTWNKQMDCHSSTRHSPYPLSVNFIPRNCHLFLVLWLLPQTTTASASAVWLLQVWHLKLTYTLVFGLFAIFRRHKLLEAFLTFSMWSICLSFFVADLLVTGVKALACMMALSTTACCTLHTSCGSIDDSISHTRSLSSTSLDSISTCDHSMTCDPPEGDNFSSTSYCQDPTRELLTQHFCLKSDPTADVFITAPSTFNLCTSPIDAAGADYSLSVTSVSPFCTRQGDDLSSLLAGATECSWKSASAGIKLRPPPLPSHFNFGPNAFPKFDLGVSDQPHGTSQSKDSSILSGCCTETRSPATSVDPIRSTLGSSASPQLHFGGSNQLLGTVQRPSPSPLPTGDTGSGVRPDHSRFGSATWSSVLITPSACRPG